MWDPNWDGFLAGGGGQLQKCGYQPIIGPFFPANYMKIKENGVIPSALLDPPMGNTIHVLSATSRDILTFRLGEIETKCGNEADYTVWVMKADRHTEPFLPESELPQIHHRPE